MLTDNNKYVQMIILRYNMAWWQTITSIYKLYWVSTSYIELQCGMMTNNNMYVQVIIQYGMMTSTSDNKLQYSIMMDNCIHTAQKYWYPHMFMIATLIDSSHWRKFVSGKNCHKVNYTCHPPMNLMCMSYSHWWYTILQCSFFAFTIVHLSQHAIKFHNRIICNYIHKYVHLRKKGINIIVSMIES